MPATPVDISVPFLSTPDHAVVLAGITTPLGNLSVTGPETAAVTVIINAAHGALYAATFPGATVSGGGTTSLWIAGSPAQVNAKLATLAYYGLDAGANTLSVSLVQASGQTSNPVIIPVNVASLITTPPSPLPALTLVGGTLSLQAKFLNGITLNLHDAQTAGGAATVVLVNSTLGANTLLDVTSSGKPGPAPRVAIAGHVEFDGAAFFHAGPALITIAQNAALTNRGQITFDYASASVTGAGTLQNEGNIAVSGASSGPSIGVSITGSGVISLAAGSHLTLGGPVAATQTIRFEADTGLLELDAPRSMNATIANFAPGDRIQLDAIHFDAADYAQSDASGTLTLYDGAQVSASLHFAGTHQLGDFVFSVATDQGVDGASITTLSVFGHNTTETCNFTDSTALYRFFDNSRGTQLLTQDPGERDAIIATRPDLVFEGAAMHSVANGEDDPDAVAVYRFFDTAHGSHFYTSNLDEKSAVLASRPDLVFEPGSTMWEHATQQAGDVPVFRFFDTSNGTHFYTANATERANILTTRLDLQAEGVAFYAPGQ